MKNFTQVKKEIEATKKQIISNSENIDRCISVIKSNVEKVNERLTNKK